MADILFSHSYFLKFDPKMWKASQPYPPLGTLYVAAFMRANKWTVALHDVMFANNAAEVIPVLEREKPRYFVLYDDGFNYLTKMCLTNMRHAAWEMAKEAKRRGCTVVVCSSDSTDRYELYLENGCDFVAMGEGEQTLLELFSRIEKSESDFENIQGLAWKEGGITKVSPPRQVMKDLDSLPTPAWDLVDIEPYKAAWKKHGRFELNLATTRGCPYKCNWCAKPIYGNRYNVHSPARVAADLQNLVDRFQPDYIWFCDDIFGLKPGWVSEYTKELEKRNLKVPFKIQSRVDLLVKDETVDNLAKAGCETVWLGAESGSQKILDAMDKGTTLEQIRTARIKLKAHGIRAAFFIQLGYLGETREDIDKTLKMLEELMPDDIGVSVSYPLPGTGFYEKVKEELKSKTNWTDSDDLALMFRNHYSPEFYKQLHRFIHKYFRRLQGTESLGKVLRKPFGAGSENWRRALSTAYYFPATLLTKRKLKSLESV